MATTQRTVPRKVRFLEDPKDRMLMHLIGLGKTTRYISIVTGLTEFQVAYRASRLPVKRVSMRGGSSPLARAIEANGELKDLIMSHMDAAVKKAKLQ